MREADTLKSMGRCLAIALLATLPGWQMSSQTSNPPAFEVVDIKPADPSMMEGRKGRILPGGRIELPAITLKECIVFGYGVTENMIVGGPKWTDHDRFNIVAKASPNASPEILRPMIQSMLADRFQLAFHREEKLQSAYVLSVGKRPAKYHEGDGRPQECRWTNAESGLRRRECHNMSMAELVRQLPGWGGIGIDLPVFDETGLKGVYDFTLDVGMPLGARGGEEGKPAFADSGPTIFAAFDQIGLKLESRKMPVQVIVIDGAELPK
jgi:uncharacterized protein (TIGR03435 family)